MTLVETFAVFGFVCFFGFILCIITIFVETIVKSILGRYKRKW